MGEKNWVYTEYLEAAGAQGLLIHVLQTLLLVPRSYT